VLVGKWDKIIRFYKDLLSLFEEKVRKNNEVISLLKEDLIEEKN
jgi:hypothetical protein